MGKRTSTSIVPGGAEAGDDAGRLARRLPWTGMIEGTLVSNMAMIGWSSVMFAVGSKGKREFRACGALDFGRFDPRC